MIANLGILRPLAKRTLKGAPVYQLARRKYIANKMEQDRENFLRSFPGAEYIPPSKVIARTHSRKFHSQYG